MFFDCADAFMIAIGSDEVVTDINKKACEILGYSKDEIWGKNWFDSFLPKAKREDARLFFHDMLVGLFAMYILSIQLFASKRENGYLIFTTYSSATKKATLLEYLAQGKKSLSRGEKKKC